MDQATLNVFTLGLGIIGSVTGILALAVSIYNTWIDRPRIKISYNKSMRLTGPAPGYSVNTEYFVVFVSNTGKRSTVISKVFFRLWNKKDTSNILTSSFHNNENTLTDVHPSTMYSVEKDLVSISDIWYIGVIDGAGRYYKKYIKRFWFLRRPIILVKLYLQKKWND